ncbi:MAG: putative Peptidase prolyl oligopeptidase [Blastococcus sp.]|nr:putative Peptidase prolyl oligopeptidase [Blastococcus sp.]
MPEQSSAPFRPADLSRFIDVVNATITPDGRTVVYASTTADGGTVATAHALWRVDTDGSAPVPFAAGDGSRSRPAFSPDGRRVAFLINTDGRRQVHVADIDGSGSVALTDFGRGVGPLGPQWSPDGSLIAFDGCEEPARDADRPYRVTSPLWRRDGLGLLQDATSDVYVVDVTSGSLTHVTKDGGVLLSLSWSPDGARLLYVSYAAPGSRTYGVNIVDLASGVVEQVTESEFLAVGPAAAWLPDGRVVYNTPRNINRAIGLMVYDPRTGRHESRTEDLGGQLFGNLQAGFHSELLEPRILVEPDGGHALVYVQRGGRLVTCRVALDGPIGVTVAVEDHASHAPVALCDRRLLTFRSSFGSPGDLYLTDIGTDDAATASTTRVTDVNGGWYPGADFTVHELRFPSTDGTEVEGWFLEPAGGTGPHPTVLNIHGGPFAGYGEMFSVDNALFTSAGYGVLAINFRGSSGYGDAFASVLRGDWGHLDVDDLMTGIDVAVERGLVDDQRLASFGLSGGGYLTAWLLSHSDRFRAGISECPVSDWSGMLASDIGAIVPTWMDSQPGKGVESMTPYTRMSPATYLADCETPMLVVAHEADLRCPTTQADTLYNSLHMAGAQVEMLRLPGIPHVPYATLNLGVRTGRAEALVEWMDRFLGEGETR